MTPTPPDPHPGAATAGVLPDFLVIGAQKSGTQWLKHHLGRRSDVFVADGEPSFFTDPRSFTDAGAVPEALDAYRAHFSPARGAPNGEIATVGEGTPGYMIWHHQPAAMARRIDEALPGVRLLAILRHPVDRAASALRHHVAWGNLEPGRRLVDVVVDPGADRHDPPYIAGWGGPQTLISGGWYGASLAPYVERFGARLAVVLHDDLVADPASIYTRALDHLGLDAGKLPDDLGTVRFSTRRPARRRRLGLRKPGLRKGLRRRGRRSATADTQAVGDPTPGERADLWSWFDDDVAELEQMLARSLDLWRP